jgi:hypothetical protein
VRIGGQQGEREARMIDAEAQQVGSGITGCTEQRCFDPRRHFLGPQDSIVALPKRKTASHFSWKRFKGRSF